MENTQACLENTIKNDFRLYYQRKFYYEIKIFSQNLESRNSIKSSLASLVTS